MTTSLKSTFSIRDAGIATLLLLGSADLVFLNARVFPRLLAHPADGVALLPAPEIDATARPGAVNPPAPAATAAPAAPQIAPAAAAPSPAAEVAAAPAATAPAAAAAPASAVTAAPSQARTPPTEPGAVVALPVRRAYFARNNYVLDRAAGATITAVAAVVRKRTTSLKVIVEGHTDETGSPAYNDWLSGERAETVATRLGTLGVPREQIVVRHFGSSRPATPGNSPRALRRNRRVEVTVLSGGQS